MGFYGYEYFCGANVIVEIERFPVLEAAGVSYEVHETKKPLYGYSSRHFDGVARGQVLVQGTLLVNYVHQDYLYRLIETATANDLESTGSQDRYNQRLNDIEDAMEDAKQSNEIYAEIVKNYAQNFELAQAFRAKYWGEPADLNPASDTTDSPSPHDTFGGLDITITFGRRNESSGYLGDTGLMLSDVYFVGRGVPIQIDENVIVEEYTFFARNIRTLKQRWVVETIPTDASSDNLTRTVATKVWNESE